MKFKNIEQSYALSPMQQGMLFHTLAAPDEGVYIQQLLMGLHEELDVSAFERAWQRVMARHPILRTRFRWEGLDEPLQDVYQEVALPLIEQDWRDLSASEQEGGLNAYLQADQERGFILTEVPLMRLALFRVAEADYQFVWTSHHALLDGRARLLLLKELFAFYEAFCQGQALQLKQPRLFREQIEWLQQQDLCKAEAFWRQAVAGCRGNPLRLPTPLVVDLALDSGEGSYGQQGIRLSEAVTSTLKSLAQQHELTLNTMFQGAWSLLLSRYNGSDLSRVLFGATRACRWSAVTGAKSMVGLFINTLPMSVPVSPEMLLLPWLKELRAQHVALREYEHTPLAKIQEWSEMPGGTPLFESILVFENYRLHSTLRAQGGKWERRDVQLLQRTNYPLTVGGYAGRELELSITYDKRRFDDATIARMLAHLKTLLRGMSRDLTQPLGNLPLLTEAERHQLLVEWNNLGEGTRPADYPLDTCFHKLFEEQVERTPDALAVVFKKEGQQLTYRELNERANQLARHLQKLGVGPEVVVGICLERSLEMIVSMLAVFKAGGAYLPLDPTYPKERLAYMLADSQPRVLLTQTPRGELSRAKSSCGWGMSEVLTTSKYWETIAGEPVENAVSDVTTDNLAYIIYTSGSTGKPKGVMVTHRGLGNLAQAQIKMFDVPPESRMLQFASFSFDASVAEIVVTLLAGATLCLASPTEMLPGLSLTQLLREQSITVVTLPPSALALLNPDELPALRTVVSAGEACSANIVARWAANRRFINAYGPTETTVCATMAQCVDNNQKPPIGRPISNTQIYLLDQNLQPVPIGVPGELYIGGIGLALGYKGRPDLTAKKFIPNPFSDDPGARLYKSGDLARYLPDGSIEFLGRIDHQVKIRGFRVELGEIESTLAQQQLIKEAIVIGYQADNESPYLVAYVVLQNNQPLKRREIREYLLKYLPNYMVPAQFVFLDDLPLTPNGKVDRKAVAEQGRHQLGQAISEKTFVAPETFEERALAKLWQEVLRIDRVGMHDNFFELGGHSLLATQLISRMRDAFSLQFSVRILFEFPTIAGISKHIQAARRQNQSKSIDTASIQVVDRSSELPLSFAQQRLWFLDQLEGQGHGIYNIPDAWLLSGSLNIAALEQAIAEIVRRHEALRTSFSMVNGQARQIIARAVSAPILRVAELGGISALSASEQRVEILRVAKEEAQRPFDLAKGPLLRVTLLRLDSESHVLLVTIHHIVYDGWSTGIFIRELTTLYEAFSNGEPSRLPKLEIQYADFAHWQRQWFTGEVLERQLNYWKQQLAAAPPILELPTDRPRPAIQTYRGSSHDIRLNPDLTRQLKALSQRSGSSLFMTLLAAFKTLLSRYSGQQDIVVGTPIAGRNRRETESLIGFFVNTLVLRTQFEGNPTFEELLNRVRQVALDAYAHQDLPFEKLVEVLQPERNLSHSALFQVMFVLQNAPMGRLSLPGLTLTPLKIERESAKFDLSLSMEETEGGVSGKFTYNCDLFDAATIGRMAAHLQTLLEAVVANNGSERRVSELPLLTEAERHKLLVSWNETQAEYPQEWCVHQLFEQQVARTPDAVAVTFGGQEVTYRELNQEANQLAHHLQSLGVRPEVAVGICTDRSIEMVVGLLAILKAGGAYVPLDPTYPRERLAFMIADANVQLLLTQQHLLDVLPPPRSPVGPPRICGDKVVCLDKASPQIAQQSRSNPTSQVTPNNALYIIYTSGSTGKPKGVIGLHRGAVNRLSWMWQTYPFSEHEVCAQKTTLNFVDSVAEIFGPLLQGVKTVLIPDEHVKDPKRLVQLLAREQVTRLVLVPSLLRVLLESHADLQSQLPNLTRWSCSGEALPLELCQRFREVMPESVLINIYGSSEVAADATWYDTRAKGSLSSVPIGRPISNMQGYILDPNLQPVPIGLPGELHIGGVGLARGYMGRPDLTEERFIANPFSNEPGARLYKSGDLARYISRCGQDLGNIEFLGRLDHQVKIRGFRIELGEIEVVLKQHPAVAQALVTARCDVPGDKRLVAYVVLQQKAQQIGESLIDGATHLAHLRHYLSEKLPHYMVPSAFVPLNALPLTPNGKVNRRALPAPLEVRQAPEDTFVAPQDELELQVTNIWEQVLKIRPIGRRDNFFELGGHSLLAVQLFSQIENITGRKLPLATLFGKPTVAQLAGALRDQGWTPPWSSLVPIQPGGAKRPFFCVPGGGGNVLIFADLAHALGSDQPFYGLQAQGLDGKSPPYTQVEEMAAHYVREIRTLQPEGPYLLGGMCFGAFVALEMAQQLHKQEQKSELFVIDTLRPDNVSVLNSYIRLSAYHIKHKQFSYVLQNAKQKIANIFTGPPTHPFQPILDAHRKAQRTYVPQPYSGKITLFKNEFNTLRGHEKQMYGMWFQLAAGELEMHTVPGCHGTILDPPYVHSLAEKLGACLGRGAFGK